MNAVFTHSRSRGVGRLVLLSMADEANDEGLLTAYKRSHSHIAGKANCDVGTVGRVVKDLVALNELEVLKPGNGRMSTDYRITLPGLRGGQDEGGQDATPAPAPRQPTPGATPPQGGQDAPPIIPFSPPPTPSTPKASGSSPEFEFFWSVWPRKTAKAEALRAWKLVANKAATAGTIIVGAQRYADDPNLPEPQFVPHASTWLRGRRWEDGPLPPRSNGRPGARPVRRPAIDTDRTGPSRALTEDDL